MPVYTFKCDECDKIDSNYLPIQTEKRLMCKVCAKPMRRYFGSVPTIVFKGAGFYVNDSKARIDDK